MEIIYKETKKIEQEIRYRCDHCEEGYMRYAREISGLRYLHRCDTCGTRAELKKKYPFLHLKNPA